MNTPRNETLTIGVLSITGVILLVGVILTLGGHQSAFGMGQIDRGGDYILVTGQFSDSTELVYVTDAAAQRTNVYSYEQTNRQFVLWDTIDLRRTFAQP
jgi:hypothetical protein